MFSSGKILQLFLADLRASALSKSIMFLRGTWLQIALSQAVSHRYS